MKFTDETMKQMLLGITEIGNIFDPATCFVGIASAMANQGANATLADVTEGTGDLADRVVITSWGTPYKMADGRWAVQSNVCTFRPASSADTMQVNFWFIASLVAAGVLKGWGAVFPAVSLPDETRSFSVVVRITIDPLGRWSSEVYWNG